MTLRNLAKCLPWLGIVISGAFLLFVPGLDTTKDGRVSRWFGFASDDAAIQATLAFVIAAVFSALVNTVAYFLEIFDASEQANGRAGRSERFLALCLTVVSIVILVLLFILILWKLRLLAESLDNPRGHLVEYVTLLLFALFAAIDGLMARHHGRERGLEGSIPYVLQLLTIDVPIFFGTAAVLVAVIGWDAVRPGEIEPAFIRGLGAGSTAMHVFYSQVVFLCLAILQPRLREAIRKRRESATV